MEQSTIALIILALTVVSYIVEVIPLSVTSILAMLAMIFTGILTPAEAFSGFSNASTLMIAGMLLMSKAIMNTGLSDKIGEILNRFTHLSEKWFNFAVFSFSSLLTVFFSGTVLVAIFMPVIDTISKASNGKITRKGAYMPAAIGGVIGAMISMIGASSGLNGFTILMTSDYAVSLGRTVSFFEPAILGIPLTVGGLIFYATFGTKLQNKCFTFKEPPFEEVERVSEPVKQTKKKFRICCIVMVCCVIAWMSGKFNIAAISLLGASILIATKCVDARKAYSTMDWSTIIIIGGSIGFAKGIEVSGAAKMVADRLLSVGSLSDTPFGSCILIMAVGVLISNFMSNNSAVTILTPISIMVAQSFGADPFPFALSAIVGCNMALSTPICTPNQTMIIGAGYKFKDYFWVGSCVTIFGFILCAITLKLAYFL